MNKPTGDVAQLRVESGEWRAVLDKIVRHKWSMPVCGMVAVICSAVLANQILAWRLDMAGPAVLPEIAPPPSPTAPSAMRISSAGFVPQEAPPVSVAPAASAEPSKSGLPVLLVGTFVAGSGPRMFARSLAIVQLTSGSREVEVLRIGEKWQGLELLEVDRSKIWVRNLATGQKEFISNDELVPHSIDLSRRLSSQSPPAARERPAASSSGPDQVTVSRSQVNRAIDNNSQIIFSWVDVQPHAVAGSIEGFRLNNIKPRGKPFFNILGFKEGDIIKRVNGVKMDSVDKAVGLWSAIHGKDQVSFSIERQGVQKELNLVFTP